MHEPDGTTAAAQGYEFAETPGALVALIHEVARLTSLQVDEALKPYHLTRAQLLTILALSQQNGAHQSEIAQKLRMGRSAVGKLLDRLEAGGYVRREHDPYDARAVRVFLAGDTRARLDSILAVANARCEQILAPLDQSTRDLMRTALTRMRDHTAGDPSIAAALND